MQVVFEGILTMLCALGLGFLAILAYVWLHCPAPTGQAWVVIYGRGGGEELEREVRSLMWLRSLGLLRCGVVIADCGLSPQGRDVARRLCRRWSGLSMAKEVT